VPNPPIPSLKIFAPDNINLIADIRIYAPQIATVTMDINHEKRSQEATACKVRPSNNRSAEPNPGFAGPWCGLSHFFFLSGVFFQGLAVVPALT
jgi:hypothetical protein